VVNARSNNNIASCKRTCPLRLPRGKENVDMIKEFLLDQSSILGGLSLSGIFDSRWCTSFQVCSSTQKIHPPKVSVHISNRLFVPENTSFAECPENIYNKIRRDLCNLQSIYFTPFLQPVLPDSISSIRYLYSVIL